MHVHAPCNFQFCMPAHIMHQSHSQLKPMIWFKSEFLFHGREIYFDFHSKHGLKLDYSNFSRFPFPTEHIEHAMFTQFNKLNGHINDAVDTKQLDLMNNRIRLTERKKQKFAKKTENSSSKVFFCGIIREQIAIAVDILWIKFWISIRFFLFIFA